jgi:hypothetical protein
MSATPRRCGGWKQQLADQPDSSMERNPECTLGPLHDERLRIDRIVDRLDLTDDLTERADLASELVRSVSRYEDTLERTLFARMDGLDNEELEAQRHHLRDALKLIHERTTGIDPRNVHASHGQTFEDTLSDAVVTLRKLLSVEDRYRASFVERLNPDERGQLTEEIAHAFRSASERPDPPHTAAGRFISNLAVKLDHKFEDVATPTHPGSDTVDG